MTVSTTRARHRAARRPSTPLTEFASAASDQMGTVGRRTAVVVGASGLVVSMLGSSASAATGGEAGALPAVDTAALTASARAVLNTSPVVTAPVEAAWTFDAPVVTAETPPPPPPVRAAPAASRSTTRAATAATTAPAETNNAIPQSVSGNAVLEIAARYVGTPYLSGGTTPDGFDCSGFTSYVYAQLGITLPRTSSGQKAAGTIVSRADAQPGDLIWSPGHISIYAGGNEQIDSPRPGTTIQFRAIWQSSPVFIRIG
ncbi:glycoside hydrolase [Cellulomonas sp. Root485]|uniref:C40 family peptidase n=1 Tax=Cellulomonas sp. Root485 TaxID=1736546 RepID=UPI0006F7A2C0|nr:C40 family peptidase [Cellulomonas sp. Root485]KQY23234.1 glycoside hydrolase [Cellulomonas sp. Root485]